MGGAAHIQGASSTLNSSLGKTHSEVQAIGLLGISQSSKLTIKTHHPQIPWRNTEIQNTSSEFVSHIRKYNKVSHVANLSATLSSHRMSYLCFLKLFILSYFVLSFSLSSLTFTLLVTSPLNRLFCLCV